MDELFKLKGQLITEIEIIQARLTEINKKIGQELSKPKEVKEEIKPE